MRPLPVMLVTNDDRGGAAVLVSRVARYLDPVEFDVSVFLPVRGFIAEMIGDAARLLIEPSFQSTPSRQAVHGFERILYTLKTRADIFRLWSNAAQRMAALIKEHDVRVLSAFGLEPHLFCALVGLVTKTPVVLNPLQNFDNPLNERIDQMAAALPSVRGIAAVSKIAARPFRFVSSKVHVCYNGIDANEFNRVSLKLLLRERFQIEEGSPVIAYVGRPTREKGIDIFLRAAAIIHQQRPAARFALIGTGVSNTHLKSAEYPFRYELPKMIEELGLTRVTTLTGAVEDVKPYLADADVVVIPSRRDAAPLVAYEAMALQVAIVGANIHGIPEIVRDEQDALLAKVGDEHDFAAKIIRLIDDAALRARLVSSAYARVKESFDLKTNVAKMGALYKSVANKRGA